MSQISEKGDRNSSNPPLGANPSGRTNPVWYSDTSVPKFSRLPRDARADVCVVGAGISGLTTAYLLGRAGKSVILLDERGVGGGESGRTSAHLASAIDDRFESIESRLGADAARIQYESHAAAIDQIERIVEDEKIECDFSRLDGFLIPGDEAGLGRLEKECEAARRAGFSAVSRLDRAPVVGFAAGPCLRFPQQARFHPLKYLAGLAGALQKMDVRIHSGTRVCDLAGNGPVVAKLDGGVLVRASFGVAATNVPSPINNWMGIYTKQVSYRSYMIGIEVPQGAITDALYWDDLDPYHYARLGTFRMDGSEKTVLLVGGEDHRVGVEGGTAESAARFTALEQWAREHFLKGRTGDEGLGHVVSRWSGQVAEPDDGVAFIGRVPTSEHEACFVITGDSGMGLTGGTLGAMLVSDLILRGGEGKKDKDVNAWASLYEPARKPFGDMASAVEFVKENAIAAGQLKDYLTGGELDSVDEISPGSGAVIRRGMSKIAAYRDEGGKLHECSAICTHLKCIVRWNGLEKSWDCPCHGSRFDAYGKVIIGPAVDDLPPVREK